VVRWLRDAGYADAAEAADGPDGVDVVSTWGLAQVRYGDAAVRRSDLQRLAAARAEGSEQALFAFTSSKFELPALTYADVKNMLLFTYDEDGAMTPRSAAARMMVGGPRAAAAPTPLSAGPLGGFWVAFVRHAPLLAAIYFLAAGAIQLSAAVQGEGSAFGASFSLAIALGLGALWFFVTRRWRPPGAGAG
jgi:hypothetical protein